MRFSFAAAHKAGLPQKSAVLNGVLDCPLCFEAIRMICGPFGSGLNAMREHGTALVYLPVILKV
jgi:hypothetical protein